MDYKELFAGIVRTHIELTTGCKPMERLAAPATPAHTCVDRPHLPCDACELGMAIQSVKTAVIP